MVVTDDEDLAGRERRKRNIALALVLGAVAVLFFPDVDRAVARACRALV